MEKKTDRLSVRETLRLHWRAAREIEKYCPGVAPSGILYGMVKAISPYATIWFSAQFLNELAGPRRTDMLLQWMLLTIGVTALMQLLTHLTGCWKQSMALKFGIRWYNIFTDKFFSMDFADMDKQETMDLYAQVYQSTNWAGWGFPYLPVYYERVVEGLTGALSAIVLMVGLFTSKVPGSAGALALLNEPVFLLAVFALLALITVLGTWAAAYGNSLWAGDSEAARFGNRLFMHFICVGYDVTSHADFRMNAQVNLADFYGKTACTFGFHGEHGKLTRGPISLSSAAAEAITALFSGAVYLFVCLKAWAGAFGVGSITQYVGAVTAMEKNVRQLFTMLSHMRSNAAFLKTTYEFLDIPNAMYQGSLTTEKRSDRQYEVEFKDVSFKYPGADNWALRHVNMKFKVGKRLAIVGENGSGKTTFIKLLCRLYDPQEGEILLNGIDIRKYNYRDYMDIFSIVFQDFQLISQPLGNNVAGAMEYDWERAEKCLVDAGFGDRLADMPDGLETYLYKDFGREGVNVSGGEAQKIAIARALYKDAPFIILDEPTAALDPIAEAEIYEKFDGIAGDKTAIYISHRLSSCKFCDEIAVFHEGAVIQQGTHAALVADEAGKYHELWNAQAQYYTQ